MKLKSKGTTDIPVKDYIHEYVRLREERKRIDTRLKEVGEALKGYAEKKGQKDDKGSYYFEREGYTVGKQARKSITFNVEKATSFFRKKGFPECIVTEERINSDAVEELLSTGEISLEDLEGIVDTKVSYSIDIKPIEGEVKDTVEETTVKRPNRGVSK